MVVIFGASGHAREIECFLRLHHRSNAPVIDFFISDEPASLLHTLPVITEHAFEEILKQRQDQVYAYIGIGNGKKRKKVADKFKPYNLLEFSSNLDFVTGDKSSIRVGAGNVFFPSVVVTTNVEIQNHNHFNLHTSVSHDCKIGSFNTFSPGTLIAGNVTIGDNNFFGLGSKIIDKVTIHNDIVIGAGAVVVSDIIESGTYVGVPAKRIK